MSDLLGAGVMGGLNLAGAIYTNERQMDLARDQMRFQERLSNTSYQRAVKDLAAAGLNPMLAYMKGGASSPPGAMAQLENPLESATKGFSAAFAARQAKAQAEYTEAQTGLAGAQKAKLEAETAALGGSAASHYASAELTRATVPKIRAEVDQVKSHTDLQKVQKQLLDMDVQKLRAVLPELIAAEKAKFQRSQFGAETIRATNELEQAWYDFLLRLASRIKSGGGPEIRDQKFIPPGSGGS